ncbi:MAG: DUF5682 family protein [Sumerlaeia bacterium]
MTAKQSSDIRVFGIRHHGPGCARSLLRALEQYEPDCILIEGPADAGDVLALAAETGMSPPVALLLYEANNPKNCVFYPLAEFSPEWQALRYGLENGIEVAMMDLPAATLLALRAQEEKEAQEAAAKATDEEAEDVDKEPSEDDQSDFAESIARDPIGCLAKAAGFDDGERWWDSLVEEREGSAGVFEAIGEAMTALRAEVAEETASESAHEMIREATMRQTIRAASKAGRERIAVVCGAWHGPVLEKMPAIKDDREVLKGLPKVKVEATWAPWSYGQLTRGSGYGAGVRSPAWFHFLWESRDAPRDGIACRWLTRVARLLRDEEIDISSAHVIESVRLVETLASLRGTTLPSLAEFDEAIRTIMLFGGDTEMDLIRRKLIVGERLGAVPESTPMVPIRRDLEQASKSLRMPIRADHKDFQFDLRKETDLKRSVLLHRLSLLNIPWGAATDDLVRSKGTFRESWRVQWEPRFEVQLVEASLWGSTVEDAATAFTLQRAKDAKILAEITELIEKALPSELSKAVPRLVDILQNRAAVSADAVQLMDSVPALARTLRYGNVRGTDTASLWHAVRGICARICVGLGGACSSLDVDAARQMNRRVEALHQSILLLESEDLKRDWLSALERLAARSDIQGVLAGKCTRLLMDSDALDGEEAARRFSVALSLAVDPAEAGGWIEGFLENSGSLLLYSERLWSIIDHWVSGLRDEDFLEILPVVRRTFATFHHAERRQIGEKVKQGGSKTASATAKATAGQPWDPDRVRKVLPILRTILTTEPSR